MLYLSTRNKADSFTAHKVLHCASAPDGGMFVPMRLPVQDDIALAAFESMSFGESTAYLLNLFFGTHLTGWDVDFSVGRQAVDFVSCGYKISLAETWHNPAGSHDYLVSRLYELVTRDVHSKVSPNLWFHTAVNIAVLFGIYGKYSRQEIYEFDVAIESADLQMLFAVRYAQKMGLPVRRIILGTTEGDCLWEFLSYGDYQIGRKNRLSGLEALLWLEFGYAETSAYEEAMQGRTVYRLKDLKLEQFRAGIFTTVVGDSRVKNVIDSTLSTNNYRMERATARAFAALQDYRAKTGVNKNTLMFARNIPVRQL